MKNHRYLTVPGALLIAMMIFGQGCAGENSVGETPPSIDDTTPTTSPNNNGGTSPRDTDIERNDSQWTEGATAALVSVDDWVFRNLYAFTQPVNNPTDLRISIKVGNNGNGKYPGRVLISYKDNNQYRTGRFITQNQTIPRGVSHGHEGKNHAEYNGWFTYGTTQVFRGFYADQYGAVLLIIDGGTSQGDGGGIVDLRGEIWVKKFGVTPATQGQIPCWFIEAGPYECRTYLKDRETVALPTNLNNLLYPGHSPHWYGTDWIPNEPERGWRRLGRFEGLNRARAFGQ